MQRTRLRQIGDLFRYDQDSWEPSGSHPRRLSMSLREAIPKVLLEQARASDETLPAAAKSTSTWIACSWAADRCACERSSRALSPATPRNGINRGTGLEERVVRALDAVHEAQGVERQRTLSRIVVGHRVVHREDAEFHCGPVFGPDGRRVVHRVARGRKLNDQAKLRRPLREPAAQLVDEEVGRLLRGVLVGKEFCTGLRAELVAAVA